MFHLSVWAAPCIAIAALFLVFAIAWYLSGPGDTPTGRHRTGVDTPKGRHRAGGLPAAAPAPVRPPNTLPVCSRFRHPLSLHALRRTIMPRLPLVHGPATRIAVHPAPRPAITPRVMPLWTAYGAPFPADRTENVA
ncbi:hypothetical protein HUT16_15085 [Kitasatospora sp. NA04385]|uniref:hypothetical protein n=1 Tax=Kitasatospora sp. NA04385 TaxID=2742135 RepID=UPI0015910044|nr:hypothetical protein [Kitasatospora sp. NA04385]QKW20217.1 hypothetical protein HUT16_15085 [Kitasatospora sp. NA04385]